MAIAWPSLEQVEKCEDIEACLRWNRFLPSPTAEHQVKVIDAVIARLSVLRARDNDAFVRASKKPPLPRGTCLACKRDVAMRSNGVTREHRHYKTGRVCPGAAMRSREEIDKKADATERERKLARATPVVLLRPKGESI